MTCLHFPLSHKRPRAQPPTGEGPPPSVTVHQLCGHLESVSLARPEHLEVRGGVYLGPWSQASPWTYQEWLGGGLPSEFLLGGGGGV